MPLLTSHRYQLKLFLSKTILQLLKRQKYSIVFDVKNVTLHFVDLEWSLKSLLASQNVMCFLTIFPLEEIALNIFWLVVHVHQGEKRENDITK